MGAIVTAWTGSSAPNVRECPPVRLHSASVANSFCAIASEPYACGIEPRSATTSLAAYGRRMPSQRGADHHASTAAHSAATSGRAGARRGMWPAGEEVESARSERPAFHI